MAMITTTATPVDLRPALSLGGVSVACSIVAGLLFNMQLAIGAALCLLWSGIGFGLLAALLLLLPADLRR